MTAEFHIVFNVVLAAAFIGLLDPLASFLVKIFPEDRRPADLSAPRYLDESALETPSLALANAARETLRMGDFVETMLRQVMVAIMTNDRQLAGAPNVGHANAIRERALMGSWGPRPFDNDEATDWYLELIETSDLSLIEEVLHTDTIEIEDMDLIEAACEVVLGLLAPDDFEQRSKAGPKHVDPLVDGLSIFRDLKDRPSLNFSIPSRLVDWVKRHRHLDARPVLVSANTILNHVKACGEAFYDGYFIIYK
jgi:hypothetical protein